MATFISISGPSTSGKTSLINNLSTHSELSKVIFSPDIQDKVWSDLVEKGLFTAYSEITTDSDYLALYLIRMIDYYNNYLNSFEDSDKIVILDSCWLDLAIYAILNMWYTRVIKSLQEEILSKISKYDERISRIYLTKADDERYPVDKFRLRGKITTFRANRPLEIQYYKLARHLKNSVVIPSSDVSEASLFILNDLKKIGYLDC